MIFSMNMEQKMRGFNKRVQQPTHLVVRSEFSEKCFLGMLSPSMVTSGGCHIRQILPRGFFLWVYLKAQVYEHRPQTLEALMEAITQEVAAILSKMTRRVMENYRERLNQCIDNEGSHVSDINIENA
jgi:hypothetical protein